VKPKLLQLPAITGMDESDVMFNQNPTQSNDQKPGLQDWNLLNLSTRNNNDADLLQLFGLNANRKSIGYRSNPKS
jgi:Fe(3+) dicitrate transport protein